MDYRPHFDGSGALYDPTPAGTHPTAEELEGARRNPYNWIEGWTGEAASVAAQMLGVEHNDTQHGALDGHKHSAVSSHPDAQFAMNSSVDSSHSLYANVASYFGNWHGTVNTSNRAAVELPNSQQQGYATSGELNKMRDNRLVEQPELMVFKESKGWSPPQVGALVLGIWSVFHLAGA